MQQIINFVIKNKTFILFVFLFITGLSLTIQSHNYHKSMFISSANSVSGGFYSTFNSIDKYFGLIEENKTLIEENKRLKSIVYNSENSEEKNLDSSVIKYKKYILTSGSVYKNSYNKPNNIITINKGENDSIKEDQGVITSKGIVGVINNTSNNYSNVLSILHEKSLINVKLKNSEHIGTLRWDTKSPKFIQVVDISKFAPLKIGDTIVTGGQSSIFPKNINVGSITNFKTNNSNDFYEIEVKLFNDMTNLKHIYVVENKDKNEIEALEKASNE